MENNVTKHKLTVPELLCKLNEIYDKEEKIQLAVEQLHKQWQQLQEDKELLQLMIMHQSNKEKRFR
jgi:hypothetical protein